MLLVSVLSITAQALPNYPQGPDLVLTPGVLCTTPDAIRYPEKIPYCNRNVKPALKWVIIETYMKKFNFAIDDSNRDNFKIDHFIPLCMGGANDIKNLWPQYKSVYEVTDELEFVLCERLSEGKITQAHAIEKMKYGKLHLDQVSGLINEANGLR